MLFGTRCQRIFLHPKCSDVVKHSPISMLEKIVSWLTRLHVPIYAFWYINIIKTVPNQDGTDSTYIQIYWKKHKLIMSFTTDIYYQVQMFQVFFKFSASSVY